VRKFGFIITLAIIVALTAIVFSAVTGLADSGPVCCFS
jgi:hypothetical protein